MPLAVRCKDDASNVKATTCQANNFSDGYVKFCFRHNTWTAMLNKNFIFS